MRIRLFITPEDEFFADEDVTELDEEATEWVDENRISLAPMSEYEVDQASPVFTELEGAQAWFEEHVAPYLEGEGEEDEEGVPGEPSAWAEDFIGRRISPARFMESEEWGAADEEGGSVLNFWLPPGTCFALFPSSDPDAEEGQSSVVFLEVDDFEILTVYDSVWLRDEWGEFFPMEDELSDEDVERARDLIEKVLE